MNETTIIETTQEVDGVVVNDDFSFIGKDGKRYSMQYKQQLFADYYLEFSGDRIEAIISAGYDVNYKDREGNDTGEPNRKLCSVMAYELLSSPNITSYINSKMAERGFNSDNVEEQHLFLLNQHADLKMKAKAVDMFYKVRGKYPKETKTNIENINVFSLADLADKSTKRKTMGLLPADKIIDVEPVIEEPTNSFQNNLSGSGELDKIGFERGQNNIKEILEDNGNQLEDTGIQMDTEEKGREGKGREVNI